MVARPRQRGRRRGGRDPEGRRERTPHAGLRGRALKLTHRRRSSSPRVRPVSRLAHVAGCRSGAAPPRVELGSLGLRSLRRCHGVGRRRGQENPPPPVSSYPKPMSAVCESTRFQEPLLPCVCSCTVTLPTCVDLYGCRSTAMAWRLLSAAQPEPPGFSVRKVPDSV